MMRKFSAFHVFSIIVAATLLPSVKGILGDAQTLTYQAHSINDLNAVRQLLVRGVQYFKIDARFLDRESCATMSTWNTSQPCYPSDVVGKSFCCIGFRGDTTGGPTLTQPFNTTDDFVALLKDPAVQAALRRRGNGDSFTHFNFDNQWGGSVVNGTALSAFAPLLSDFMLRLDATLRAENLYSVTSIDADFGVIFFADSACAPPTATVGTACTPTLQALAALPFRAETGFPPRNSPRSVVANVPASSFQDQCSSGFPGHAGVDDFPYIFWEPSTQADILGLRQQIANCSSLPPSHSLPNRGLRNTCNQEPEMYAVFSADSANDGSALLPGLNTPLFPPQPTVPLATLPLQRPAATHTHLLLTAGARSPDAAPSLSARPFHAATHSLLPPAAAADVSLSALAGSPPVAIAAAAGIVAVASANATVVVAKADPDAGTINPAAAGTLPLPTPASTLLDLALCPANPTLTLALSTAAPGDGDCAVALSLAPLPLSAASASATAPTDVLCVLPHSAATQNASFQGSLALTASTAAAAATAAADCGGQGLLAVVDATAPSGAPFIHFLAVTAPGPGALAVSGSADPRSAGSLRDTGRAPSVTAVVVDGEPLFAEVHTDGLCECGFGINNGDMDHCSISAGAQPPLRSVAGLLNFNSAPLSAWTAAISAAEAAGAQANLSFCHPTIVHGKVDTGVGPSAALVATPVLGQQRTTLLALSNADVAAAPLTNAFCGAPVRKHNVTLDAWRVPPPAWMAGM